MAGKLRPRFRSSLSDLGAEPDSQPELAIGTPLCPRCGTPDRTGRDYCASCGMSMAKAFRYGIDGPAEGVWTTPGPHGVLAYKSIRTRSTVFRSVLMAAMVCSVVASFLHFAYYAGLDTVLPALPVDNRVWADWIGRLTVIMLLLLGVVCVTASWWTSRAYRNLIPMQVRGLRVPVSLARVAWLLPFLNVWLSKLITDDLYRASDPTVGFRSASWRKCPVPLVSNVGWTGSLCALLLVPLSYAAAPDIVVGHEGQLRVSLLMGATGYLLAVMGLSALIVLVAQIADRQAARVDRLGTSPRPTPLTRRSPDEIEQESLDAAAAAAAAANSGRLQQRPKTGEPLWGSY